MSRGRSFRGLRFIPEAVRGWRASVAPLERNMIMEKKIQVIRVKDPNVCENEPYVLWQTNDPEAMSKLGFYLSHNHNEEENVELFVEYLTKKEWAEACKIGDEMA